MERIWKEIEGTAGRYSISNDGQVRANWSEVPQRHTKTRLRIEKQKLLKLPVHTAGYYRVALGRGNQKYVHRLVAAAFLDNPENLPQVDHIDGNRQNNHVSNLRWVSAKQNSTFGGERHSWENQKKATAARRIHIHRKEVYAELRKKGYSYRYIAWLFNTSHTSIMTTLKSQEE